MRDERRIIVVEEDKSNEGLGDGIRHRVCRCHGDRIVRPWADNGLGGSRWLVQLRPFGERPALRRHQEPCSWAASHLSISPILKLTQDLPQPDREPSPLIPRRYLVCLELKAHPFAIFA